MGNIEKEEKYTPWLFIIFPAIAMLLGWGLRGYIGGGPFGAMIPGAMVAISISLLLELPPAVASVFVLFGVVGIGLGGEMTYGQTIGFLRNSDTMWWGTLGLTLKGGVWGFLGGIVLAMGLIYDRLSKKTILITFLLLLAGMLVGFKLINQPMVIYFSDPVKPRSESWGALLVGAITILIFLKNKVESSDFKTISRFAFWGLIGGAAGFGLGGFWIVMGSHFPKEFVFQSWWKAMEFTFGLLFGATLGYAAWLSRNEIVFEKSVDPTKSTISYKPVLKEIALTFLAGILIFWLFSAILDPVVETGKGVAGFTMIGFADIAKIFSNYAFFGLILIAFAMRFPFIAWQFSITLTFCHTVIDLMKGFFSEDNSSITGLLLILLLTLVVSMLTAWFQRRQNLLQNLFLLLIWSTMSVAFLRLAIKSELLNISGLSICEIVCGRFFVHIVFTVSAIFISWISTRIKNKRLS